MWQWANFGALIILALACEPKKPQVHCDEYCALEAIGAQSKRETGLADPRADSAFKAPVPKCVRLVSSQSVLSGDGLSWQTAFRSIGSGIRAARRAIEERADIYQCEVWVAAGTYYLFRRSRADTLALAEDVHLYGGFNGREQRRDERDFVKNVTTIDGRRRKTGRDRVYHVVTGANRAVLDGFTVTNGYARSGRHGGGMYNERVSPVVRNCVFVGNRAGWSGGAIYNLLNRPDISKTVFLRNRAKNGGAVLNHDTKGVIQNCVFRDNRAYGDGGAVKNVAESQTRFVNCVFYRNRAKKKGSAVYNEFKIKATFTNCTFYANRSKQKLPAVSNKYHSKPTIVNSVLWDNGKRNARRDTTITYSVIQRGFKGVANSDRNPRMEIDRDWFPRPTARSNVIDAADVSKAPLRDLFGRPRHDVGSVRDRVACPKERSDCAAHADLGAIEYRSAQR